jgi:hypothetical protein
VRKRKVVSKKLFSKYRDSAVNYLRCAKMRILCGKFSNVIIRNIIQKGLLVEGPCEMNSRTTFARGMAGVF